MICLILFVMFWLACALFVAGAWFADFQGRFPKFAKQSRYSDLRGGAYMGLFGGPVAAILIIFLTDFLKHGWKLK